MKMDGYVTMGQQAIHRRQNKVIMKFPLRPPWGSNHNKNKKGVKTETRIVTVTARVFPSLQRVSPSLQVPESWAG